MTFAPPHPHSGARRRARALVLAAAWALALGACAPTEGEDAAFDVRRTTNDDFDVSYLDAGLHPIVLGAADIDSDGLVDIAVSNRYDNSVTVFTGGLQASETIPAGVEPTDVVFGNYDGANGLDLAVLSEGGLLLSLYFAKAGGGWEQPVNHVFEGAATQVSPIDLNGDESGPDDLIVTVTQEAQLWAFVNDGTGDFSVKTTETNTGPTRFLIDDYSGDGFPDLAVLNPPEDVVTVYLGDGTGAFTSPDLDGYDVKNYPLHIVQADFNDDGNADLAVVSRSESRISVLLGNGQGAFDVSFHKNLVANPDMIVSGAFDTASDGPVNDVAFIHVNKRRGSLLTWNDEARFSTNGIRLTEDPITIAKGDFNLDGCLDLLTTESTERVISISAGNCTGEFERTRIGLSGAASYPLVTDLEGDGKPDVVLVQTQSQRLIVLRNRH